jgi:hypothetical protein
MEAASDRPRAITVAVAKAAHEDLSRQLALTAEFRPFQEIDVHAKVAGYLKKSMWTSATAAKKGSFWRFSRYRRCRTT